MYVIPETMKRVCMVVHICGMDGAGVINDENME